MLYCKCHNRLTVKECVNALIDEVKEYIEEPSWDEFSDIVYCVNRFAGTITGRPYLKIIPGDALHVKKIAERMHAYNCIRSKNHLKNGQCPSI